MQLKSLYSKYKRNSGRNNRGKITVYNKGGGHKRKYRKINFNYVDFFNKKEERDLLILDFQYDPNRNTNIALVYNPITKQLEFRLRIKNTRIGDFFYYKKDIKKDGNIFQLKDLPLNTNICCIERSFKDNTKGGTYVRSAGGYGKIINKYFGNKVLVQLPSGYYKFFDDNCHCIVGSIYKPLQKSKRNKAGRSRWLGKRPAVRGVAMNPIDHPHGGGEGKTSGGRCSVTPWGILTKGYKTRKKVNFKKLKNKSKIFEARFNKKLNRNLS